MNKKIYNRREFLAYAALGMGAVACGKMPEAPKRIASKKPNLLFIIADQMRYCALGCMGNSYVRTPNLDELASQGILFTNAFSSAPVCGPYRAQLMTGKYSHKNGVVINGDKLPEDQNCIAEILKEAGYATGYIGKWHLNGTFKATESEIREFGFVPPGKARQGWDYWAVLEPYLHNYYKTQYYRDTEQPILIDGYEPDVQTDLAIEYMKANKDHPFCLMLSWGPPHAPYQPPSEFAIYDPAKVPLRPNVPPKLEAIAGRNIAGYYGLITSLDANIGRIVKALDNLNIAENTIICYTSDHGCMLYSQGEKHKQRPWEESIHIPFIMRYPNKLNPNQKRDILFNSVDVMPTLLGLCDLPVPYDVQGKDLSSVILSKGGREPESAYFAITSRYAGGPGWDWRGVRTKEWMYATTALGGWVLYNLKEDPYEMNNLITDDRYKNKKRELNRLLKRWVKNTGDNFEMLDLVPDIRQYHLLKRLQKRNSDM